MSKAEERRHTTKAERQRRINRIRQRGDFFRYLFTGVSFAGWIVSVGLYLMYLMTGTQYSEIQYVVFVAFAIMFPLSRGTLQFYFRRLPSYAIVIPAAILLYGIWHLSMGSGTLDKMPSDVRVVAKYHQMIFGHSLIISGYTFFCFLWSYIHWEQSPKKKRA